MQCSHLYLTAPIFAKLCAHPYIDTLFTIRFPFLSLMMLLIFPLSILSYLMLLACTSCSHFTLRLPFLSSYCHNVYMPCTHIYLDAPIFSKIYAHPSLDTLFAFRFHFLSLMMLLIFQSSILS
jgi:hypothetical protein